MHKEKVDNEKISVILPVYNAKDYISECIRSILLQSYNNFEIIIVDDGSTDGGINMVINEFRDSRITIIQQENSGVSVARNKGIEVSSGDWIMFIDADDYIDPKMIEDLMKIASQYSADIVVSDYFVNKEREEYPEQFLSNNEVRIYQGDDKVLLIESCIDNRLYGKRGAVTNIGVPWGRIYRKKCIMNNRFIKNLTHMEDMLFNMRVMLDADRIVYYPKSYYHYRLNMTSAVHGSSLDFEKKAEVIYDELIKFAEESKLMPRLRKALKYKGLLLFHQCIVMQYIRSEKYNSFQASAEIKRINNIYSYKGNYTKELNDIYTLPQLFYAILASMELYFILYNVMRLSIYIKKK